MRGGFAENSPTEGGHFLTDARSQQDLSASFRKKFGQIQKNSAFSELLFLGLK
jgi:hypothetical protein